MTSPLRHYYVSAVRTHDRHVEHRIGPYTKRWLAERAKAIMESNLADGYEAVVEREDLTE